MYNRRVNGSLAALVAFSFFVVPYVGADSSVEQVKNSGVNALEGVTVGIDVVYSHSNVKNEQYDSYIQFVENGRGIKEKSFPLDSKKHKRCNIDPSINVGYSYFNNAWHVGIVGEISFGRNRSALVRISENYSTEAETAGFSSKVKVKGGYYFEDLKSVIYAIAGLKWRNVETQYKYTRDGITSVGSKAKLSHPLYVVGVGLETPVCKKLSVSAEYEYTWRNSRDNSTIRKDYKTNGFYVKQSLKEHNFKLGIKYHI